LFDRRNTDQDGGLYHVENNPDNDLCDHQGTGIHNRSVHTRDLFVYWSIQYEQKDET